MYSKYLPVFIDVANAGSFSKAAEKRFISPAALIKQINRFENELDMKLFERSHTGLKLTEEGKFLYEKAQQLIEFSDTSMLQARKIRYKRIHEIVIGCSHLRHFQPLIPLIKKMKASYPEYDMKIMNFSDSRSDYETVFDQLGTKIDCFFAIYPSDQFKGRAAVFPILSYPICLAVSINHSLSSKKRLNAQDLAGQKIMIVERGDADHIDRFRDWLETEHPEIEIINTAPYDLNTFNLCNKMNGIMISADLWKNIHPLLVHIPFDSPFSVPYGLIYAKEPDEKMRRFIRRFQKMIEQKS